MENILEFLQEEKEEEIGLVLINDSLDRETLERLKEVAPFDPSRVRVVIDQVVPANSQESSALHADLRDLALDKGLDYSYGLKDSLNQALEEEGQGLIVGSSPALAGASQGGSLGLVLDGEDLIKAFESGRISIKKSELLGLELKGGQVDEPRTKNLQVLGGAQALDKDPVYIIDEAGLEGYRLQDRADLILLLRGLGIRAMINKDLKPQRTLSLDLGEDPVLLRWDYSRPCLAQDLVGTRVHAVYMGGPIGGGIENIRALSQALEGKSLAYKTRVSVSPASQKTYLEAVEEGLIAPLLDANVLVLNPSARPPIQARIGSGEVMVSNDWETGPGFAGPEDSRVILARTEDLIQAALRGKLGPELEDEEESLIDKEIMGRAWVFGTDVDTDIIIPTQYLNMPIEEMKAHAFEPLDPSLAAKIQPGDILVAADNFGAGSSREMAAEVLAALGIRVIIAGSFARIFFRNAINNGILLIENKDLHKHAKSGDKISLRLNEGISHKGKTYPINQIQENLLDIIADGGLVDHVKKQVDRGEW